MPDLLQTQKHLTLIFCVGWSCATVDPFPSTLRFHTNYQTRVDRRPER
ncbi:MAG: hypothetical protein RBJ76_09910 [Stenomitos frigidus ULC029]